MEHDRIVESLSEYRDGALSAAEREAVSSHLGGCADCSKVLADWERLSKTFFRAPAAPTAFQTEAFVARVTTRLPGEAPSPFARLTGRWLVPALGLSFAMLAFSFRPYARQEISDPAGALLAGPPPETAGADVLGLGAEDR